MTAVMNGVRILEVAEHTFVPAASALLVRLGRRGHQDRARRARRRHAGPRLVGHRPGAAPTSTPCSSTPTGASRASASTSPRPTASTSSTSSPRPPTSSSPTSCPSVRDEAPHRPRRHPGRTTPTSSTCAAPARASAAPTPTRAPTTRSPSGPAPGVAIGAKRPEYDLVPGAARPRLRRLDRRA